MAASSLMKSFSPFKVFKKKKNKIVVYTAIFGGKDDLNNPEFIPENCDFICFTDSDFSSKIWKVKKVKPVLNDPVRNAKRYKILPHRLFPKYEYSIWIDGNITLRADVNNLIYECLENNSFAAFDHSQLPKDGRNCIYEEAKVLIEMAQTKNYKDDPVLIKAQIEKYMAEKYPENNGLISGMILLRRHNSEDIIKVMEDWWQEIKHHSRRDQLSFNYVAWKNNLRFKYINGDSRDNKYFIHSAHKKKESYRV